VRIHPGFATKNLLLFQVIPRQAGYEGARLAAFYDSVQRSLSAIPGVRSATLMQFKLLSGTMSGGNFFTLPGHAVEGEQAPRAHRLTVSETFFDTMGLPILAGRGLRESDAEGASRVVVVNETFAQRYLSTGNSLGQILQGKDGRDWQIVGVCHDAKYTDIKNEVPPTVYFSFRQDSTASTYFALRTALPPLGVATAARRAVATVDPGVPVADITTQEQVRDKKIAQERLFATLCSALAGLAVLLSCLGLYGLIGYHVARRTSEIGLRMALGATPRRVAVPVLREALLLTLFGLAVGLPAAFAAGRVIRSQLYGVTPYDPLAIAGAVAALIAVAVIAAWLPARRAAEVDPMTALRCE